MLQLDPAAILRTLNAFCTQALEAAAGLSLSRGHYEVTVEHLVAQLIANPNGDAHLILRRGDVDTSHLEAALTRTLEAERSGNSGRPVFSPLLLTWLRDAWLLSSVELRLPKTRSGSLLAVLANTPHAYTQASFVDLLASLPHDQLRRHMPDLASGSVEDEGEAVVTSGGASAGAAPTGAHSRGAETALGKFTEDYTAQARSGELDPVIGRESEIRQCIDILARRRKNNPIIVGEAGVGKTALVEGIAQRVVLGEVPPQLQDVDILGLDMGLLQAGASVKGEFENRLKSVIEEVQASAKPIILFIDEAHTLIGAGGAAGGSDAANLLKPALARGELRTLAATTWSEYKKYFEKDAALTRRFQLVRVDEPSEENAVAMMRGLAPHYEKDHAVRLRDDGVVAAVELSARYISGRQLPDKAVDLLDTCAARVSVAQGAKPASLIDLEQRMAIMQRERDAIAREVTEGRAELQTRLEELDQQLTSSAEQVETLTARWKEERDAVGRVLELRGQLAQIDQPEGEASAPAIEPVEQVPATDQENGITGQPDEAGEATREATFEADVTPTEETAALAKEPDEEALKAELAVAQQEVAELQAEESLVPVEVGPDLVAAVVSDWTGIPVGKMVQDEAGMLLALEERLAERIRGQSAALESVGESVRAAKLGLGNPRAPIGVFLLVGPSGVGKTETALALADLLFGGERFLVTINMSEFQEKHTVSRLIGSPPGYVGYGEGGVLTEAVRQRPYSAVVLDEVEKADPEVLNLFYQVFDKGQLSDGEGRVIDFRNTVILMTSNLGSDRIAQLCDGGATPERGRIVDAIRPALIKHFKPALLGRMSVVPYLQLSAEAMREIVDLKLDLLRQRLQETHRIALTVDEAVSQQILDRCAEVETGARNIDHIISRTLLPLISRQILEHMARGPLPPTLTLRLQDGAYTLEFS